MARGSIILEDQSSNLALVPDSTDASIYKSIIRMNPHAFYQLLSKLNGASLISHQIQVARFEQTSYTESVGTEDEACRHSNTISQVARKKNASVNDDVLETIAERLLASRAIEQMLVPDAIE